eukprot:scaffold64659_cov23-Tisochrysis_lutea.AAC.1
MSHDLVCSCASYRGDAGTEKRWKPQLCSSRPCVQLPRPRGNNGTRALAAERRVEDHFSFAPWPLDPSPNCVFVYVR